MRHWLRFGAGLVAGAMLGAAAALLLSKEGEPGRPGLGARLMKRVPMRVKLAGALGAVKGAGAESWRLLRARFRNGRR